MDRGKVFVDVVSSELSSVHAAFLSMIPKLCVEFFVMSNLITAKFQKLKLLRSKLPASERKRVN